jgi:spermidine/putrescine-binding protein
MKKVLVSIVTVFLLTVNAAAGDYKVIAMVNSASWCGVCKANDQRIMENVMPAFMMNSDFLIVMNDLSDKDSKARSKADLEKAGVYDIAQKEKKTGMIHLINPASLDIIASISVSESDDNIRKAFREALSKVSVN